MDFMIQPLEGMDAFGAGVNLYCPNGNCPSGCNSGCNSVQGCGCPIKIIEV